MLVQWRLLLVEKGRWWLVEKGRWWLLWEEWVRRPLVGSAGNHLRSETRLGRGSGDETHMCTGLGDGARTGLGLGGQRAHLIGIVV